MSSPGRNTLNSNIGNIKQYKDYTISTELTIPNGFSVRQIVGSGDWSSLKQTLGINTVTSIWVSGGYADQWQITASLYGDNSLWIQSYSKYSGNLKNNILIHLVYY